MKITWTGASARCSQLPSFPIWIYQVYSVALALPTTPPRHSMKAVRHTSTANSQSLLSHNTQSQELTL
ncbi:hypothetical protein LDENG_00295130 [Lucifuga dentata]|nr:hypothetical protein LDENG_00295130 [Lucifuga dentata]